jgi:hypothetical protein
VGQKIKLGGKDYEVDNLSDQVKTALASLQFATTRLQELDNMQAVLQRAKNSYVESLKKEMLSSKAGAFFEDD